MKRILLIVLFALGMPLIALAQSAAGFATQSVFLSTNAPVAGEHVSVYASVFNTSSSTFNGKVRFSADGAALGVMPVTLLPGQAIMASTYWTPSAGQHTVVAALQDTGGQTVASQSQAFAVAAPPAAGTAGGSINPPLASSTPIKSGVPIDTAIASVSPAAARALTPILGGIDAARSAIANFLGGQIETARGHIPATSTAGIITGKVTSGGIFTTAEAILWTFYYYLLVALRFVVAQFIIFYPLLVLIFFWLLYRLYRRMSRPSWQR